MRVCLVRPPAQNDQLMFADMDTLPDISHHIKMEGDEKTYRAHKIVHVVGTGKKHHVDIYLIRVREL